MPYPASPNSCGVLGLLQAGTAFDSSIVGAVTVAKGSMSALVSQITALPTTIEAIAVQDAQALVDRLTAVAEGAITSLISHLTAQFANLVSNLSVAAGQLAAQAGLVGNGCGLPSMGNTGEAACPNINGLFGSLMGGAQAALDQLTGLLASVTVQVNGLTSGVITAVDTAMAAIGTAMSSIEAVGAQVSAMVTNEVAALANAVSDMLSFGSMNALFGHAANPCTSQVLQMVATSELRQHLGI